MDGDGDAGADYGLCSRALGVVVPSMETDFSPLYLLCPSVKDDLAAITLVCFGPQLYVFICFLTVLSWIMKT